MEIEIQVSDPQFSKLFKIDRCRNLNELKHAIATEFNLKENQINLEDIPKSGKSDDMKKKYKLNIKKNSKDIKFQLPNGSIITINDGYKEKFNDIIHKFESKNFCCSLSCAKNNLKIKFSDIFYYGKDIQKFRYPFLGVPENSTVQIEAVEKFIILEFDNKKFYLSEKDNARTATDLIFDAFKKNNVAYDSISIIKIQGNQKLNGKDNLIFNEKYRIEIGINFSFYNLSSQKYDCIYQWNYFTTVSDAQKKLYDKFARDGFQQEKFHIMTDKFKNINADENQTLSNFMSNDGYIYYDIDGLPKTRQTEEENDEIESTGTKEDDSAKKKNQNSKKPKIRISKLKNESSSSDKVSNKKQKAKSKYSKDIEEEENESSSSDEVSNKSKKQKTKKTKSKYSKDIEEEEENESSSSDDISNKKQKAKSKCSNIIEEEEEIESSSNDEVSNKSKKQKTKESIILEEEEEIESSSNKDNDDNEENESAAIEFVHDNKKKFPSFNLTVNIDTTLDDLKSKVKKKWKINEEIKIKYKLKNGSNFQISNDTELMNILDPIIDKENPKKPSNTFCISIIQDSNSDSDEDEEVKKKSNRKPKKKSEKYKISYQSNKDDEPIDTCLDYGTNVKQFKKILADKYSVENLADIKIIFAGKDLLNDLILDELNIGDTVLNVYIRSTDDIFLMTAKALRVSSDDESEESD